MDTMAHPRRISVVALTRPLLSGGAAALLLFVIAALAAPNLALAAAPKAPTNVHATAGVSSALVSWTAPTDDGGSPITVYWAYDTGGTRNCSAVGTATSCTVTGLTNGTPYAFKVYACNIVCGSSSVQSNTVTPANVPGAPTAAHATGANSSATLTWTAPASNGGSPITGYTVVASGGGGQYCSTAGTTSCTVAGLANGTPYTFTVRARNVIGWGPFSAASNSITPAPTVPGPPTSVAATPGNGAATVTWVPPASNGGSAIKGYVVVASGGGGQHCESTGAASCTVTGLANGTAYSFQARAENAVGWSAGSAWSSQVTPAAPPAPIVTPEPAATAAATAAATSAAASESAPASPSESASASPTTDPSPSESASASPTTDPSGPQDPNGGDNTALLIALILVGGIAAALLVALVVTIKMLRQKPTAANSVQAGPVDPPPGDNSAG